VSAASTQRKTQDPRLDAAVKSVDGFFTTFFVSPYSKYIARWAARRGITPNAVTITSAVIGVLAAAAFATGERWGQIAGAVLLQVSFTTDCVDGQLARYTQNFSKFGAWLDSTFDRAKEWAVYAGLAIGSAHDVWVLAAAALTLQTVRHAIDFSYLATRSTVHGAQSTGSAARAVGRWTSLESIPGLLWVKRIIAFPIGERFAAISITAAIWDPRVTFVVLLAWGGFALLYSLPGRVLRTFAAGPRPLSADQRATLRYYQDDGPLASRIPMPASWIVPPAIRTAEYGVLIWIADGGAAAFALVAALAYRHYDLVYRLRNQGARTPAWLGTLAGGWDGRLVLAWVLLAAGALPAGMFVLAGVLAALFVTESAASWVRFERGDRQGGSHEEEEDLIQ
jgi:phosphatidylglycerophosphate synthase